MANSTAILTDAFPVPRSAGMALGVNMVAGIAGSFIGLVLGGVLADINWRLVFWVNVPFGLFGTVWAYLKLRETGSRKPAKLDWAGNITFAVGLISILIGHHLRHPALRRSHDGLDQPRRPGRAHRRCRCCWCCSA